MDRVRVTRRSLAVCSIALAMSPPLTAAAQTSARTPTAQAVKSAADATRAAQQISLDPRNGSGVGGSVGLYVIGRSRTRIVVRVPSSGKYRVMLYPGSDCSDSRTATAADVALSPTIFNTTGASTSSTIVSLPIEKVRSNYVVDIRDAGNRQAVAAACARLKR